MEDISPLHSGFSSVLFTIFQSFILYSSYSKSSCHETESKKKNNLFEVREPIRQKKWYKQKLELYGNDELHFY